MRRIILTIFAILLVWLVISQSLSAYLAEVAPEAALWLNPREPDALVNLTDRLLNSSENMNGLPGGVADQAPERQNNAPDSTMSVPNNTTADPQNLNREFEIIAQNRNVDLATIRARAETALMHEPLNAHALQILGQVASVAKDDTDASKFMAAAGKLSLHESVAINWLMRKSIEANDYKMAIYYADALLRKNPGLNGYVLPILAHFAEEKAAQDSLKAVLDSNPPWRGAFLANLPYNVADARTPLLLLLALKTSPTPPTPEDIGRYLALLISNKFYDLAYYTWLQFLPLDELHNAGLLFNGSFEVTPSGLPFDWVITQGSGVTVDIVPRPDKTGEHALLLDFLYGRVDYHSVTELVMLAPGTYQFDGQYKGEIDGPRGLKWRIVCAGEAATRIGESLMIVRATPTWKQMEFTFTVPAANCRAQYVQLDLDTRMGSEQLVTGSMLFAELHISRVASPPRSQQSSQ
jgi:hypothetical protein